ncbi:hypothetical protein GCM10009716_01830 [Streptomyces sodiiphilus]|uniref:Big-1 domain-containing protein n=1 Tax=Streptomyces sodiiphilus TaxID=226217 RepID=A0ABN2NRJ7_9ACTN
MSITTLTSAPDPSVVGELVTFTVTVVADGTETGTPTGTVLLTIDGVLVDEPLTLDVNGQAEYSLVFENAGTYNATAAYQGVVGEFDPSSDTDTQQVDPAQTTTTLDPPPQATAGEPVTWTAFVAVVPPGAGTPTGTVDFTYNGTTVTGTLQPNGEASVTVPSLPAGTYTVTAVYSGDPDFVSSTSAAVSQVVVPVDTQTVLTFEPVSPVSGETVDLVATVSAVELGAGTPTGTVEFTVDGVPVGTGTLDGSGVATVSTSPLLVGSYTVTADYQGEGDFGPSSDTAALVVAQAETGIEVTADPVSPVVGEVVTFTATVSAVAPGAGTPTGTVEFTVNGTVLTGTLDGSGVATASTPLDVGTYTVTATYQGDGDFTSSVGVVQQVVQQASSETSVSVDPSPSVAGEVVSLTATVSAVAPGAGTPTGLVQFTVDGVSVGTGTLDGSGVATVTTALPDAGSYSVVATYLGDAEFVQSSDTVLQVVEQASSETSLVSDPNPSVSGEVVTFTATVSAVAPGAGTPTGTVEFTVNGTVLTGTLDGSGVATASTTLTTAGPYTLTATYSGDAEFLGATDSDSLVVQQASSETSLVSDPNPSVSGEVVTFTATVSAVAPGAGTPTGTVEFVITGGPTLTGTLDAGGVATVSAPLTGGSYPVTATYQGDGDFTSSSDSLVQVVGQAQTTTSLVTDPNPSVVGETVTFTATVAAVTPGSGTPTGSVLFEVNGTMLTGTLDAGGVATVSTELDTAGLFAVTATYQGDSEFAQSSGTVLQVVEPAATTTVLTSAPNPSSSGEQVTFTATVTADAPGAGTPTGTVQFFVDGALLTGTLDGSGVATVSTALPAGTYTVTANYQGDGNYQSSSDSLVQVVEPAETTVTLTAAPNPAVCGEQVTLTATVASTGDGVPTGAVEFVVQGGPTYTAVLDGTGTATVTADFQPGTYLVTATYAGDGEYAGATSNQVTLQVNQAQSNLTLTSSPNPSSIGQTVTFCATVQASPPGAGTPSGTVTFVVAGGPTLTGTLNANGQVCVTTSFATAGPRTVTATYSGDTCFAGSTGSMTHNVGATATRMTASPATVRLRYNGTLVIPVLSARLINTTTGAGIPGQPVTFRANTTSGPVLLGTAVTDANGVATLTNVPVSWLVVTADTYTASFAGGGGYGPSSAQGRLTTVYYPPVP